ncbi:MAG: pyridoxamine 5'-phosphate oxidase family protein [Gammaproteobacteria bacterium]|nr:pyridoxamine 5'-phosphate oxidase family protein [Gammaproteobacteria bacterium]
MTRMTQQEKEQFLADLHVGVLGINRSDLGPLTVPIWYSYEPGGELQFITGRQSAKGKLLDEGVRVTLCAQNEDPPYQYVSVEGAIVSISPEDGEILPMAKRYLGEERGSAYAEQSNEANSVVVRVLPDNWLAVDYGKTG